MSEAEEALSPTQIKLMTYVDGEMSPEDRRAFEQELSENTDLAAELAELQSLADLTQSMALAEPSDHELRRFWEHFYNRSEWQLGWLLLLGGLAVVAGWLIYLLLTAEVSWLPAPVRYAALAAILGAGILFWNTLRLKIRTSRFDRYRGVMR